MINFSDVYEGWRNKLVPPYKLRETIKQVSKERLLICKECPEHSSRHSSIRIDEHCNNCGCPLGAKTACLSCECPLQKWLKVIDNPDEEQTLKNKL